MPEISTVIITYNEAKNIEACICSAETFSDEIVIIDSYSTDSTPEICKAHAKVKFHQRVFTSHGDQKNYGISLCENDYILSLDADEQLSPELLNHLCLNKQHFTKHAYSFKRLNHIGKEAIRYGLWYPDEKIRLFRRDVAKWEDDVLHEKIILDPHASLVKTPLHILHFGFQNIEQFKQRSEQYAQWWAKASYKKGKRVGTLDPILHASWTFFRAIVLKRAFLDGGIGLRISVQNAKEVYLKYKLLRLHG